MSERSICPKCSGTVGEGFLLDQNYQTLRQSLWISGAPEAGGLLGQSVKISGKEIYAVRSLRCTACGFLEVYADRKPIHDHP